MYHNPHAQALLEFARREQRKRARDLARNERLPRPREWAERHRTIDDKPFRLDNFQPLQAIYDDDHPFIVIMKPAQVGVSEMAVTRACHALDIGARFWNTGKAGLNVAYLFPTLKGLTDFSKERFSSLLQESEYLQRLFTGGFDEVSFKQAGQSYLYLRGAWAGKPGHSSNSTQAGLKSFPADVLILDEFDEMDAHAIALAEKRLRASAVRRRLYISTPTLPGRGIHASYLLSDQREWEVHCPACDGWSTLDFFRDVLGNGEPWETWSHWERAKVRKTHWTVHCPACREEIDRCGPGRWVARAPDVEDIRGYQVPALCFPTVQLVELAVNATSSDPSQVEEFFRSDLGVPYQKAGSNVTDSMLAMLEGELPATGAWNNVTMGVDVGSRFHYRISGVSSVDRQRYVLAMGAVKDWDALSALMKKHKVRSCVIDALPELHACQQWASGWGAKVKRAFYPPPSTVRGIMTKVDEEGGTVQINRTMAMDAVFALMASGDEVWPRAILREDEVVAHMKAPVRVMVTDADGQPQASWTHTGPDHLYHACVYDMIAADILPKGPPQLLITKGVKGWSPTR